MVAIFQSVLSKKWPEIPRIFLLCTSTALKAVSLEYDTEDEQSKRTKDAYIICETAGGPRIFIG